jgi:aspartate racemase
MTIMKTIGIIGGSTDLATAEYYKRINAHIRRELGGLHTGEIIINSMDLANSAHYVRNGLWEEGIQYLHNKAKSLERAGADFIVCVSNTWHQVSEGWMKDVQVPLLHIVNPTGEAIQARGLGSVALLGTKATMSSPYLANELAKRFGIKVIVPDDAAQQFIDDNIFEELSHSLFTELSRRRYLAIIDELVAQGAQGVILGCTEIPLLVSQLDRPDVPMFDTLELHASAAALTALRE